VDHLRDLPDLGDPAGGRGLNAGNPALDVFRGGGCLLRQFLDLVGDNGKSLPGGTGTGCLNGRVQR